ncbi:helix-turn-helix- domain containing protein AraC type [Planctopirus limnophila DSM 3776]|uniref:Helix-turn-helix-domain containing protein AraC type n=1 Tax=Planctopirus limnophila (strain ATCC 43296 / DSM 3776 / IFAM 1008 / Mu 290) TaxID=521674 RepID=D5SSQ6_PLAL2|nr:XylR family transcriptional regulator [Planctopirus limnophila]ADG68857.1 helix-turn-helix- domain containing protein AraC type [Planctopirus limnophila DSM 3776]
MPNYSRSVAVLIETGDSWGRNVVEAVARYAQKSRWALVISPRDEDGRLRLPHRWQGDGAVAMLRDVPMARSLQTAAIPVVDVDVLMRQETWVGRVVTDDRVRIAMAFEHFRSKNFTHFACFAPHVNRYPDQRSQLFQQVARKAGFYCCGFDKLERNELGWYADPQLVAQWIRSQPSPLAVFAPDPVPARQLAEICQWEGIHIPDEVAILSGDTDDLLCSIASPPISSVELDCARIGHEACALLHRMMNGRPAPKHPKLIPPLRVIARHSTEILAVADQEIGDVLRFIRSHACEGIRVPDILKVYPISRRTLEQKFQTILGRTPSEEIRRTRLEQARNLLVDSDLPISSVATKCGFSSSVEFSHAFRKYLGIKPSDLRPQR